MTWWQLAFLITGIVLAIQGISIVVAVTFGPRFLAWLTERLFKAMTVQEHPRRRAGGEVKRLWRPGKTTSHGGSGR